MNRAIKIRLKRLEAVSAPIESSRRVHLVSARTDQDRDAAIAHLWHPAQPCPVTHLFFLPRPSRKKRAQCTTTIGGMKPQAIGCAKTVATTRLTALLCYRLERLNYVCRNLASIFREDIEGILNCSC
jgi:hypothetical protein